MGQSRPSPDRDIGPLASGNLEFLGLSDTPDVGVPTDAGDGEDIHSYVDDGSQRRVQWRGKKNEEATRQSELHSSRAKNLPGASLPHHLHRYLKHDGGPECEEYEREGAKYH